MQVVIMVTVMHNSVFYITILVKIIPLIVDLCPTGIGIRTVSLFELPINDIAILTMIFPGPGKAIILLA